MNIEGKKKAERLREGKSVEGKDIENIYTAYVHSMPVQVAAVSWCFNMAYTRSSSRQYIFPLAVRC